MPNQNQPANSQPKIPKTPKPPKVRKPPKGKSWPIKKWPGLKTWAEKGEAAPMTQEQLTELYRRLSMAQTDVFVQFASECEAQESAEVKGPDYRLLINARAKKMRGENA